MWQTFLMGLKEEIEQFLGEKGAKAYELADLADVPRTCVYRLLNGDRSSVMETTAEKLRQAINSYQIKKQSGASQAPNGGEAA
jgi:predicted transcriptional regulator